jgi:hypothetical protein
MQARITIENRRALRAIDRTQRALSETHRVLEIVSRGFRDHVRKTINSQDGGSWEKPSKWTRAKKRTNRALSGQANNITNIFASRAQALVVYQGASKQTGKPISITEHHFGKVLLATNNLVRIPIRNPAPLKLSRAATSMWFKWGKNSIVPRRKIWPDRPGEADGIAQPLVHRWVAGVAARTWK